jgi:DNA polymerase III subunit epsilon
LDLDHWKQKVETEESFIWLNLFPEAWRLSSGEFVAFGIAWCNPFNNEEAEEPYCYVRVPPSDVFPQRDKLLRQVRPALVKIGFEDHLSDDDALPLWPLWKYFPLDSFRSASGFDADTFVMRVVETFRGLLPTAGLIDQVLKSVPAKTPPPPPVQRRLKTIAFVDTETTGTGAASKMTELAIINAAYDEISDQIVGVLEEYSFKPPKKLDEVKSLLLLARAEIVVAHNAEFDRGVLARALPGAEKRPWRCSWHGIDWKNVIEVHSESLETLLSAEGLRSGQEHSALGDANDLLRLLAVQHDGKSHLARLLSNSRSAIATA